MKVLKIACMENTFNNFLNIGENEFPNIEFEEKPSDEEFNKAIDTIITYFAKTGTKYVVVDLKQRDDYYEKELMEDGYDTDI